MTANTTTATTSRCKVLDQIVEWTAQDGTLNVQEGDLILHDRKFEVITSVCQAGDDRHVRYTLEGTTHQVRYAYVDGLVAVRRYVETTED